MTTETAKFFQRGHRLTAFELARAGISSDWNEWRQETDMLGDYQRHRVNLAISSFPSHDFREFDLTNVTFYRSDLSSANLDSVDCAYADFHEAKLIGADLRGSNLRFARLSRAFLREANLDHADLRGADLRRASLRSASLLGADVRGVDLSSTRGLDQSQLDELVGDNHLVSKGIKAVSRRYVAKF